MKKILLILGFVSQLVAGCSDFFDTAPSNKIPTTMAFRTVTQLEFLNDVITKSTLTEISQTDAAAVHMIL